MSTALVACSLLAAAVSAPVPRELENTLLGAWVEVSTDAPPGTVPPEPMSWTFEKGTVTVRPAKGDGKARGFARTLAVDGDRNPKSITLTSARRSRRWVQHGLFKIDGDRLTICLGMAVGDAAVNESGRPRAFEAGDGEVLVVLKRAGVTRSVSPHNIAWPW